MFSFKSLLRDPALMVSVDSLKRAIDVGEAGVIVDVRTIEEYNRGHLAKSINIPVDELSLKVASILPLKTTRIFCYCHTDNRSWEAAKMLRGMGYQLAYAVEGGIAEWVKKNYPVVK